MAEPRVKTCIFCKNDAEFKPLKDMSIHFDIYYCFVCDAEFLYMVDSDELWSHNLYTYIQGELYRWSASGLGPGYIWHIGQPGIPGVSANRGGKLLLSLKQQPLPDVTPQNIKHKLRTWITFS